MNFSGEKKTQLIFIFSRFAGKKKHDFPILMHKWPTNQRYRIFFFSRPWTLVIHSFKSENRVFFFPRSVKNLKKKNTSMFFFFSRKSSSVIHSDFWWIPFFFYKSWLCFIFSEILCVFWVFFFLEKFTSHSLLGEKKKRGKKTFHSFIRNSSKNAQKRTFPGR